MANATTPQVVKSYLAQLEKALADVTVEVRDDIVSGIAEELEGLDAAAASTRIEELGDPEFIAAEARAEAGVGAAVVASEPRWYPVLAALLVAFGGIVIPFVGWIVGLAMVWFSKTWTRTEKWIATLVLPATVAILWLATILIRIVAPPAPRSDTESINPLVRGRLAQVASVHGQAGVSADDFGVSGEVR